jgi:hypothetical protein
MSAKYRASCSAASTRRNVEHALLAVYEQIGEPPDLDAVGGREADHLRHHIHRELAGEVGDEVEAL